MLEYAVKFLAVVIVLGILATFAFRLVTDKMDCDDSIVKFSQKARVDYNSSATRDADANMQATCKAVEAQARMIVR